MRLFQIPLIPKKMSETTIEYRMTLPDKASDLLELALKDMEAIRNNPEYLLDMGAWHRADVYTGKCHVCLAGAVIASRLDLPPAVSVNLSDFDEPTVLKLLALDNIRRGDVISGLRYLYGFGLTPNVDLDFKPANYGNDFDGVVKQLTGMVQKLRVVGY